jgi:hypothetical protein
VVVDPQGCQKKPGQYNGPLKTIRNQYYYFPLGTASLFEDFILGGLITLLQIAISFGNMPQYLEMWPFALTEKRA